jgi:hypothetical protein
MKRWLLKSVIFLGILVAVGFAQAATRFPTCTGQGPASGCITNLGDIIVDIRRFGAKGDGSTDDTAAIQAAIDYAYNNDIQGIYCPSGRYKISGNGNAILYLDAPGNLRSNWSTPSLFSFSLAFVGESGGIGNGQNNGCKLLPTTDTNVALIVGTGQHMTVKGVSIVGPNSKTYRGNLSPTGTGIGIAGGSGGASFTLIESTYVANFYKLYATGVNGVNALGDSNTWRKTDGNNGFYCLYIGETNNFINNMEAPRCANTTNVISSVFGPSVVVIGGNLSPTVGARGAFGISNISNFTKTVDPAGGGYLYTFASAIAAPDAYWPNVYNSFVINTAHFGLVPLTLTNWNARSNTATFQIWPQWVYGNWGNYNYDMTASTDIQAEVAAATTVYATERMTIFNGPAISAEDVHLETDGCQTLYDGTAQFGGASRATIKNVYFNGDAALRQYAPAQNPSQANLGMFYACQSFPVIRDARNAQHRLRIEGGDFGQNYNSPGIIIEQGPTRFLRFIDVGGIGNFINMRVATSGGGTFAQPSASGGGTQQIETQEQGAGEFDRDYFLPRGFSSLTNQFVGQEYLQNVPFYGYHPAPGQIPNLIPDTYSLVSGTLGALGTYPPIDCQSIFQSVGWNSGALGHHFAHSASCPSWSWGQNLTDTLVGEMVKWSYKGQSAMLYLDTKTLNWMFPGLAFQLSGGTGDGSNGTDKYIVTGVYPELGYVTAIDTTNAIGAPLPGNRTIVYSCSSSCTIKQAAYSWTQF